MDKSVFRTSPKPCNGRALHSLAQINGNGPPQVGTARLDASQLRAIQDSSKTAHGRFNFRKLWHAIPLAGAHVLG